MSKNLNKKITWLYLKKISITRNKKYEFEKIISKKME